MKVVIDFNGEEEVYEDIVTIKEITLAPEGEKRYFFWRYKAKEEDYIVAPAENVKSIEANFNVNSLSNRIMTFDLNSKNKCSNTFTPVMYNVELSLDDISLVEKHNGSVRALFLDPLYIKVLKCYFKLLKKDRINTLEVSNTEFIYNILSTNENTEEAQYLRNIINNPAEHIRQGINKICDAVGFYRAIEQ